MTVVLAISLSGLVLADQRRWPPLAGITFAGFWVSYALWNSGAPAERPVAVVFLYLSAGFLVLLAWLPWRVLVRRLRASAQELVAIALNAAIYFAASYTLLAPRY